MKLSAEQKQNIQLIVNELYKKGITNAYAIAGVLSVVGKESGFIPKSENLNYSASRLLQVFPSKVKTQAQANALANKPELIANTIYGGRYGNLPNEGYKYRGRGFNQITFKSTYKSIGLLIGRDLVANPDLLNTPQVAAEALVAYFMQRVRLYYPKMDVNKISNTTDSLNVFYNANAGAVNKHLKDTTGGYAKAKNTVNDFYNIVSKAVAENKTTTGGGIFFLIVTTIAIVKRKQIAEWVKKQINKK